MRKYIFILSFLPITAVLFSCKGLMKDMSRMGDLQDTLTEKYNVKDIKVEHTNNTLEVSFVNTAYNDSSSDVQERIAQEVGEIVQRVYNTDNTVESGLVKFVDENKGLIGSFTSSSSYDMHLPEQSHIQINADSVMMDSMMNAATQSLDSAERANEEHNK